MAAKPVQHSHRRQVQPVMPNPSIGRTVSSELRPLPTAAPVKR
jgi:hypothetical protein